MPHRITLLAAVAEGCKVKVRRLRQLCQNGGIPSARLYGVTWTVISDGHGRIKVIPAASGPACSIEQPSQKRKAQ